MEHREKDVNQQSLSWFFGIVKSRIAWWFIIATIASIITVQCFVSVFAYQKFQQRRYREAEIEGLGVIKTLLVLGSANLQNTKKVAEYFKENTILEGAEIYDTNGQRLLQFGQLPSFTYRQFQQLASLSFTQRVIEERWLDVAWSKDELQVPYYVIARLDLSQLPSNFALFVKSEIKVAILQIIALLFIICAIVSSLLLRPLLRIKNQLQKASNDPGRPGKYQLSYSHHNEIGEITTHLNELLIKQQNYIELNQKKQNELDAINKNLEALVAQRTDTLQKSNDALQQQIEQRKQAEESMISTALLPDESTYPIVRMMKSGEIIYFNRSSSLLFKKTPKIGMPAVEEWTRLGAKVLQYNETKTMEWCCKDRSYILNFVPIVDREYVNIYAFDITLRKQHEEKITHMSSHDLVTGLPNLSLFQSLLEQLIQWSKEDESRVVLVALSIRDYDSVTKFLGHHGTGVLLHHVAQRIQKFIPTKSIAGHLLNNEFVVAKSGIENITEIDCFVDSLKQNLTGLYQIKESEINIKFSFGITIYPDDNLQIEKLISNASMALYYAVSDGQDNYSFFAKHMNEQMEARHNILSALTFAIERNELEVYYQPQYDISLKKITGVEALLRWHHPELGDISPAVFIPLAEESGEIIHLTRWVLENCTSQLSRWKAVSDLRVSVNISMIDFNATDMTQLLLELFEKNNLSADRIELEITETALTENIDVAKAGLAAVKQIGVPIAIDDFGTGYCSMQYLQDFPVDKIKVDRTFVKALGVEERNRAIVASMVHLAKGLDLELLAEGVETQQQVDILLSLGCSCIQGYFYSKPLPVKDFEILLGINV